MSKINKITHQELQFLYGYSRSGAIRKLNVIRSVLAKTKKQMLTVNEFCKAEGISLEDFDEHCLRLKNKNG